MKCCHSLLLGIAALCVSSGLLSAGAAARFLDGEFRIIHSVQFLPDAVKSAFMDGSKLDLADPGKEFERGCVRSKSGPPGRRLIFAAVNQEKCIVHFESGGYAHTYNVAVFALRKDGGAEKVWRSGVSGAASNLDELRAKIAKESAAPKAAR